MAEKESWLDRMISAVSPQWGLERLKARRLHNLYRSARSSRQRQDVPLDGGSADRDTQWAAMTLAQKARYFDQNNEHIGGGADFFQAYTVGPGIRTEPLIKRRDGTPHTELNEQIKVKWRAFMKRPDISGRYTGARLQRLLARTYFREGEFFLRFFEGRQYPHHTEIPLSVEVLELDQLPHSLNDRAKNIVQGIELSKHKAALAYHFYKRHPGDVLHPGGRETVRVAAQDVLHLAYTKRLNQKRGVSQLHSVMERAQDVDDIDRFELAAAKQGASMGLAIHRTADYTPDMDEHNNPIERPQITKFWPGMVLDGLDIGEEAHMLSPNGRPNPHLEPFRDGHLRAMAAGTGLPWAAYSRKYTGTYSSERQARVDGHLMLEVHAQDIVDDLEQPMYERFLKAAVLYGEVEIPWEEIDPATIYNASHKTPQMPWIDPMKEVRAKELLVQAGFDSRSNQIRAMGRNPDDVRQELRMENELDEQMGMSFTTSPDGIPDNVPNTSNVSDSGKSSEAQVPANKSAG